MESKLNWLFCEWNKLGASLIVTNAGANIKKQKPEQLISETTNWCRFSSRLTWVVIDWLIHHIEEIDESLLLELTKAKGDLAVLGFICDAAYQKKTHLKFEKIAKACQPNKKLEIFFYRISRNSLASKLAKENALSLFKKWNFISNELRYL